MNHRRRRDGLKEGWGEEERDETPLAICQELLSCFYRVAVARSHIKQINLVRGSVYLRAPAPFRSFHYRRPRVASDYLTADPPTLLLFYLNSSSKWGRSRGYRGSREMVPWIGSSTDSLAFHFLLLPLFLLPCFSFLLQRIHRIFQIGPYFFSKRGYF